MTCISVFYMGSGPGSVLLKASSAFSVQCSLASVGFVNSHAEGIEEELRPALFLTLFACGL